jgi:hypothetical protein
MPTIIGIPAGKMIRTSVISDTDDLGLSRLTETYAFATSEFELFRTALINLTPYNTIMNYVHPTSSTQYPYLTVESADITQGYSGISTATVRYVGILKAQTAVIGDKSWLPPSKQRIQPLNSTPNPVLVVVDFIYYSDAVSPDIDVILRYGLGIAIPPTINGVSIYRPITPPSRTENLQDDLKRQTPRVQGSEARFTSGARYKYYGMLCVSHFSEKLGLFYRITNTYQDCSVTFPAGGGVGVVIGVYPSQNLNFNVEA